MIDNSSNRKSVSILLVILALGFAISLYGCIPMVSPREPSPREDKVMEILSEAEEYHRTGVHYNFQHRWKEASKAFDKALELIEKVDAGDNSEHIDQIDNLLRQIAYDYQFTISQSGTIEVQNAPAIMQVALSKEPLSEPSIVDLKRILQEIPTDDSRISYDFPILFNDRVLEKIVFFQTDAREPFSLWLSRSKKYLPMCHKFFTEEGLPLDLCYLPLIESGFDPKAYSWAHASGLWQFIKSTGHIFDLETSWWIDERRDPEKSTRAAAKYFKRLYSMFGDWHLALASYNCGEGRIKRSIKKQKTNNFWELNLPTQTENYVPSFIAALVIARDPELYSFNGIEYLEPIPFDVVKVHEVVDLKLAARCAEADVTEFRVLNPELIRGCTPPNIGKYPLKVPKEKGGVFVSNYRRIPDSEKVIWHQHTIKKGESFYVIAKRYGVPMQSIISANNMSSKSILRPSKKLLIPISRDKASKYVSNSGSSIVSQTKSRGYYAVKKGDTVSEIAEKLGVSQRGIMTANKLSKYSVIKPGQKLTIPGYQPTKTLYHTVRKAETLWKIANKYGVTVMQIKSTNKLNNDKIKIGQKLVIKTPKTSLEYANNSNKPQETTHVVKKGESLWLIAKKYNVSVSDIRKWNNLKSNNLSVGKRLNISSSISPSTSASSTNSKPVVYTVRKGDTLWDIAKKYGVSTNEIMKKNKINNPSSIKPGDKLRIVME